MSDNIREQIILTQARSDYLSESTGVSAVDSEMHKRIDDKRIKLAEAMGWVHTTGYSEGSMGGKQPFEHWSQRGGKVYDYLPFNPFTDANDDYAVLEWMRDTCPGGCFDDGYGDERPLWVAYLGHVIEAEDREDCLDYGAYQIGDYARAALKVIDDD